MARTTLDIDDRVLRAFKQKAAAEGRTLQSVVNEHLKRAVSATPLGSFRLELRPWRAELRPGVDLFDRGALLDPAAPR